MYVCMYAFLLVLGACSAMEQKVDHATEMTVQGLQKREDSAQHIKRCLLGGTLCCVAVSPHVSSFVGCSLLEQKIDQMSVEFTRKLQEREDTALQYNRCLLNWDSHDDVLMCYLSVLLVALGAGCLNRRFTSLMK